METQKLANFYSKLDNLNVEYIESHVDALESLINELRLFLQLKIKRIINRQKKMGSGRFERPTSAV